MNSSRQWQIIVGIVSLMLLAMSWTCVTNPVTGKKELMLISEADEIAMGAQVHQGLGIEYGFYEDPQLTAYVRKVAERLLPAVHRPQLKYHFHILDTPVQNAFAAPGGYIYITRGLLAMMNSEAELAVVLGHELGHVNARHSASKLSRNLLFGIGLALAGELNEDIKKAMPAVQIATALVSLQYSRDDEYQADGLGVAYARSAHYNPTAMIDFFSSLEQLKAMSGGGGMPNFLSTHPLTPKRIEAVKQLLQTDDLQLKTDERSYLARINGLDYGPSPLSMRVENGMLLYPKGQYALQLQTGWKVSEQGGLVTLVSADEKTVLLVKNTPADQALPELHRQHLEPLNPLSIIDQQTSTISGRRAQLTMADKLENGQRAYGLQLLSLIHGRQGFGFYLLNEQDLAITRVTEVHSMISSLRSIRPSDIPKSRKLSTRPAGGGLTLEGLLDNWKIPSNEWNHIAFLNRLPLDKTVAPGRLIKLIR